jgi:hypothetical protein
MADISPAALAWIVGNETGISSKNIWKHMIGAGKPCGFSPADPSDFGRCARLLVIMPEWRDRIAEMAKYGERWAAITKQWQTVHDCMAEEVGIDWSRGRSASRTYDLMQSIYSEAKR